MSGTFDSIEDAEAYAREYLEGQAEGGADGDRPTYSDEVDTSLEALNYSVYETLKDFTRASENVTPADCMDLHDDLMWRACVLWLGEERARELVDHYLRPSPEAELEALIRSVGMGYHPDTPWDGYEPPITQYTREEWERIHEQFRATREGDDLDIYDFGLNVFNEMEHESRPANGATRTVQGVQQYWAQSLNRWVTIPED